MTAAATLADKLAREARSFEVYVERVENLLGEERVPNVDLERAYAAGYMLFVTSIERTLEQLFVGLLTHTLTVRQPGVRPVVKAPNRPAALRLILGGRNYVDWLPFDQHTRKRAKALLVEGRPFTSLGKGDRTFLERMSVMRNALAHQSTHALRRFDEEFIQKIPVPGGLPPEQHKPVGYLRGQHSVDQTRLTHHLAEATQIMRRLTA